MNTYKHYPTLFLTFAAVLSFSLSPAFADDLNPPAYRDDPLSVYAHWEQDPATTALVLTDWNSVDDSDPTTTLYPMDPPDIIIPDAKTYEFYLPNFIDKLPVKYMRLQLTWSFVDLPPDVIGLSGTDDSSPVPGNIVYTSPLTALTDPSGIALFYQYHDIEFYPNPDQERWLVTVPDNAFLVQAVADTVSTIPEPATLLLLGLGSIALIRKR